MVPTLDALRARYPHLSFCLYAFAGDPVKLECITADGKSFTFSGPTEAAAILSGFADDFVVTPPAPAAPATSVFD